MKIWETYSLVRLKHPDLINYGQNNIIEDKYDTALMLLNFLLVVNSLWYGNLFHTAQTLFNLASTHLALNEMFGNL